VLANAAVAVGNSSSFVRDSTFLGTPVVLVGDRQNRRERGENAVEVVFDTASILAACRSQIARGRYAPGSLYGDGNAAARIADTLAAIELYNQKTLAFGNPNAAATEGKVQ